MSFLRFLRENWIWWVAPIVIVICGLAFLVVLTAPWAIPPFVYAVFRPPRDRGPPRSRAPPRADGPPVRARHAHPRAVPRPRGGPGPPRSLRGGPGALRAP